MVRTRKRRRRLWDAYCVPGFRPQPTVHGVFGDPKAHVIKLKRRSKNGLRMLRSCPDGLYDRKPGDLSYGDTRVYLDLEVRRLDCRTCGKVKREQLALHQTVCTLCRPPLPGSADQGSDAGLKYWSAAAATVAKFTAPAPVHKKRVSAPSKKPAGAIRRPPPGA
jgi:hypothetical protein